MSTARRRAAVGKIYFFPLDTEINGSIFRAIEGATVEGLLSKKFFFPTAPDPEKRKSRWSAR
jgi:hypothetical protein